MTKTMRASLFGLFLGALYFILLAVPAGAEIRYQRFTLVPELHLYETYRSNIFQTESNKKSDFITTVTPGLALRYNFGRNSLSVDYRVAFLNFAKYSSENYQDHRANALLNLIGPGGVEFTFGDSFVKSSLERTGVISRQRPFHENFFNGAAAYRFADRWKLEAKYNRDDLAFGSTFDRYAEYTNNLMGASLYYRLLPRTSGLIEYDYAIKDFVTSNLSNHHDQYVYGGLAFDPAGKLRGTLKGGYGWKNFDHDVAGRDNSPRNWIMAVQLVDDLDPKTTATFDALRTLADDIDLSNNASYTNTLLGLTLQHFFTGKIGGAGSVSYRQGDYLNLLADPVTGQLKKRTDKVWTFGAAGFYNIQKWWQTRLEYQYLTKDSNFNLYSFDEHRVILKLIFSL